MKKFNQFQLTLIKDGLELLKDKWKQEIAESEKNGKINIFHPSFVDLSINETILKATELTKKKQTNLKKIDLLKKVYAKYDFVKIKNYDHCVIGIEVQTKRLIYSISLIIESLKTKMEEEEAIDYFYHNIYENHINTNSVIFCEDFFYYDKF